MLGTSPFGGVPLGGFPTDGPGSTSLEGRGWGKSSGVAQFVGLAIPMEGGGSGMAFGRLGARLESALSGRGSAAASGRGGARNLFPLVGRGVGNGRGRASRLLFNALLLEGTGKAVAKGRLVARAFGDWVAAFSAFFWKRDPRQ